MTLICTNLQYHLLSNGLNHSRNTEYIIYIKQVVSKDLSNMQILYLKNPSNKCTISTEGNYNVLLDPRYLIQDLVLHIDNASNVKPNFHAFVLLAKMYTSNTTLD